jgi:uncharacterized membrane protein YcgQ (UPF0703/DUF1980 family)
MINASDTVTAVNIKCKYAYFIFILTYASEICGFVQLSLPTKELIPPKNLKRNLAVKTLLLQATLCSLRMFQMYLLPVSP